MMCCVAVTVRKETIVHLYNNSRVCPDDILCVFVSLLPPYVLSVQLMRLAYYSSDLQLILLNTKYQAVDFPQVSTSY